MVEAVIEDYKTSLEDLTFNSKPHINALTMLAEEYLPHADVIVRLIEAKLNKAPANGKLPLMYLMDSIVKNVKKNYVPLFAENLVKSFHITFDMGDEKTKISLYKLRSTWDNYFPLKTLYKLDVTVNGIDSNWPVKPLPASLQEKQSTSIHVNPKFLKKVDPVPVTSGAVDTPTPGVKDSVDLKQDLINKQKQLLDLQQQKLLLELEQTKQQLALREKRNQLAAKQPSEAVPKDPRLKHAPVSAATGLRVTVTNGQKPQGRPAVKDPRSLAVSKQPQTTESRKQPVISDPRTKNDSFKKSPTEAEKVKIAKKSPTDTDKTKKKKVSPQGVKNTKLAKTPSPKNNNKTDGTKKTKVLKKKTDGKAVKNLNITDPVQPSAKENVQKGRTKPQNDRDPSKKRDRPSRRSPPRNQAPPAKQARRSTSVERRNTPSPTRKGSDYTNKNVSKQRHAAIREEEQLRRGSPRSTDGSISPRFSPEPDESPAKKGRNWRPPVKRLRPMPSHGEPWQREEGMPPRPSPPQRRRTSVDPNVRIPQELTLGHQAEILKQAEIQLQSGQLTHSQHQELLKQLHQLFELQRIRSLQHIGPEEMPLQPQPPMPLNQQHIHRRREEKFGTENKQLPYRPPPSPPRMDVEHRDKHRPSHSQRLSPPPMPPADPRMNHPYQPSPSRDDQLLTGPDVYMEPPPRPPFLNERERHHEREVDNRHLGRIPGPNRRRHSRDWERPPNHLGNDFGENAGNVFVIESGPQSPVREEPFLPMERDPPKQREEMRRKQLRDAQNAKKPHSERVPLRAYAHPETDAGPRHPAPVKRKNSREDRARPRRSPTRKGHDKKSDRRPLKPSSASDRNNRVSRTKNEGRQVKSDDEDQGPRLEEPEDYIIANIPPEAEVYHQHSLSLKKTRTSSDSAAQDLQKQSSLEDSKDEKPVSPGLVDRPGNLSPVAPSSPDVAKKIEDEVNRSPSLPLKKRKYLISSSSDIKDSSEAGTTEPESDTLDTKSETATNEIEKTESDTQHTQDNENEDPQNVQDDKNENPEIEKDEGEKNIQPSDKVEGNEDRNTESQSTELDDKPNESLADDKKIKNDEKPAESGKEKRKAVENAKSKKKEQKEGRLNRIQELAMKDGSRTPAQKRMMKERIKEKQDKGPKGLRKGRAKLIKEENLSKLEQERMVAMMEEEEEMLRWEAELEKELEREEFARIQEMEAQQRHQHQNRGGPPRRGWGRERGIGPRGAVRGRGFGRERRGGRRNWGGNDEFWEEDQPERIIPLMAIGDDRPPFPPPDRRHPDRMLPHPDRMPPHRGDPMEREWFGPPGPHDRNRRGPPPPEFDGPWVIEDEPPRGPPMRGERFGPRERFRPGPPDDRMHPPPYHPDERMEMDRGPRFRDDMHGPPPPQHMHGPPGPAVPPQPEMNQVNVNKLLSDLLNMGIIPGNTQKAPEPEKPSSGPPSRNASPLPTNLPLPNVTKPEKPATPDLDATGITNLVKSTVAIEQEAKRVPTPVFEDLLAIDPDASLPEITFEDVDKLKIRCDELIKRLYTGIQCSACGMRFTACQTDMYAEHLDWHYRVNRKDKDGVKETHRSLYPSAGDWIMYEEIVDPTQRVKNQVFDEEVEQEEQMEGITHQQDSEDLVVPVAQHPEQDKCTVCNEAFKTVYNDEEEEWQYVNCVAVEGKNFHPSCYADHNDQRDSEPLPTPIRVPIYNPLESTLKGIPGLDTLLQEESETEENEIEGKVTAEEQDKDKMSELDTEDKIENDETVNSEEDNKSTETPMGEGEIHQEDEKTSEMESEPSTMQEGDDIPIKGEEINATATPMAVEESFTSEVATHEEQSPHEEIPENETKSDIYNEVADKLVSPEQDDVTQPFVKIDPDSDVLIHSDGNELSARENANELSANENESSASENADESFASLSPPGDDDFNENSTVDEVKIKQGEDIIKQELVASDAINSPSSEKPLIESEVDLDPLTEASDAPSTDGVDNIESMPCDTKNSINIPVESDHGSDDDSDDGGVTVTI